MADHTHPQKSGSCSSPVSRLGTGFFERGPAGPIPPGRSPPTLPGRSLGPEISQALLHQCPRRPGHQEDGARQLRLGKISSDRKVNLTSAAPCSPIDMLILQHTVEVFSSLSVNPSCLGPLSQVHPVLSSQRSWKNTW